MHVPKLATVLLHVGAYAPATSGIKAAVMQLVPKSCGGFGFENAAVNSLAQSFSVTADVPFGTYAACVGMLDVLCVHTDIPYSATGAQLAPMLPALQLLASEERTSGMVQAYAMYVEVGLNIIEAERHSAGVDPSGYESVCWGNEAVRGIDFILRSGLKDVPKFISLLRDVRPRKIAHPQVQHDPQKRLASEDTAKESDALLTPAAMRMGGGECTAYYAKLKGDTPALKSFFSELALQACRDNGAVRSPHSPA